MFLGCWEDGPGNAKTVAILMVLSVIRIMDRSVNYPQDAMRRTSLSAGATGIRAACGGHRSGPTTARNMPQTVNRPQDAACHGLVSCLIWCPRESNRRLRRSAFHLAWFPYMLDDAWKRQMSAGHDADNIIPFNATCHISGRRQHSFGKVGTLHKH